MTDKIERFEKVATSRVNAAIDKLRLLGQCGNRNNYSYTREQVDVIFRAINKAARDARSKFNQGSETEKFKF